MAQPRVTQSQAAPVLDSLPRFAPEPVVGPNVGHGGGGPTPAGPNLGQQVGDGPLGASDLQLGITLTYVRQVLDTIQAVQGHNEHL